MKDLLAAGRYARALFEIAHSLGKDEEIEAELESFSAALKSSPSIHAVLRNPYLRIEEKKKFLANIYRGKNHEVYKILQDFFSILFEKGRFELIHEIAVSFKKIADESQGQALAEIKTAVPLNPAAEKQILAQLEKITGYQITVKKSVDPRLVGGVEVRLKNRVINGSVKNRVELLKKELTRTRN